MENQPTCGKGLAENAALPWKLGELTAAMGAVLEAHMPALDLTDENSRHEHEVYQRLVNEFHQAAAQMEAIARQMSASRDLPMGAHDMALMATEDVKHTYEHFLQSERDLVALLQRTLDENEQTLC